MSQRFEAAANLSIVALCLLLGAVLIRDRILTTHRDPNRERGTIGVGNSIELPDVNWKASRATLLFVIDADCRFCL